MPHRLGESPPDCSAHRDAPEVEFAPRLFVVYSTFASTTP